MPKDLDSFAAEWFRDLRTIRDESTREKRLAAQHDPPNAADQLMDIVLDDPSEAWRVTVALIDRADGEEELAAVAAGPLEDLIRDHAGAFADRIVAEAHANDRFRKALNYVWGWNDLEPNVRAALVPLLDPETRAHWDDRRVVAEDERLRNSKKRWRPPSPRPRRERFT